MGDHVHGKGEWMLSYRYMFMDMDGMYKGSNSISSAGVFGNGYNVTPTRMTMEMQMLGAMYAPNDRITLSGSSEVVLGAGNDTSNFLFATQLYNNGTSNVTGSGPMGTVDLDQPIATSGLIPVTAVDGDGNGRLFINGTEIAFNINTDSVQALMTRINSSDAGAGIDYDPNSDRFTLENAVVPPPATRAHPARSPPTSPTGSATRESAGGLSR